MKKYKAKTKPLLLLFLGLFWFTVGHGFAFAATASSITQYGITWTFDKDYEIGQFANGDYWVAGSPHVTVVDITPKSYADTEGVIRNGSILNPDAGKGQGFDSRLCSWNSASNAGMPGGAEISSSNPLVISPVSSLLSSISRFEQGSWSPKKMQLLTVAVLTVLDSPPLEGSFRPPYAGANKSVKFNISNIDYTKLGNYTLAGPVPRLKKQDGDNVYDSLERTFERPWLDYLPSACGSYNHPDGNMPSDGGWLAGQVSNAALILNSNYSNEDKKKLLISFIETGIDNHGVIQTGAVNTWGCDGQIAPGRKFSILFAGIVLNDQEMKAIGKKSGDYLYEAGSAGHQPVDYVHFGEDDQTFYVTESDIFNPPLLTWLGSVYAQTSTGGSRIKVSNDAQARPRVVTRDEGNWSGFGIPTHSYDNIVIKVSPGSGDNLADWVDGVDVNYPVETQPQENTNTLILGSDFKGELGKSYDYKIGYTPFFYGHGDQWDYIEYTAGNLGLPEWGIRHSRNPISDGLSWDAPYRYQAQWFAGFVLATRMMAAKELWHHEALFDYEDRFMSIENSDLQATFIGSMWNTHRSQFGCVWTRDNPNDTSSNGHQVNCPTANYGDVSGDMQVTAYDAALVAQAGVGLITLTADQTKAADVSGDGQVTAYDAALIAQRAVGLIDKFSVEG